MHLTRKTILISLIITSGLVASSCGEKDGKAQIELIPVSSGGVCGYVDTEGKYKINPQFSFAGPFFDGRALVSKDGLKGYIDESGVYAIPPKFSDAIMFTEGTAWTVEPDGAPVLIDKDGNQLLVMQDVERVWAFTEGLALVQTPEGRYGFIDHKGNYVIEPVFSKAHPFSDGYAEAEDESRHGWINHEGKWTIADSIYKPESPFIDGYAVVRNSADDFGVIDKTGKYVINPQFDMIFPDGKWFIIRSGDQYGWCDRKGKIVINPQFEDVCILGFNDSDLAPVKIGNQWGYIDRSGKIAINPQFSEAYSFADKKFAVVAKEEKYGFIDTKGSLIVNPQFQSISTELFASQQFNIAELMDDKYVVSRYFNSGPIVDAVMKCITNKKVDGLSFDMTIGNIMKKYGMTESDFQNYGSLTVKKFQITKDVSANIDVEGDFAELVSDGWWGMTTALNRNARPDGFYVVLRMSGKAEDKKEALSKAFADKMGLNVLKNDDNYRFAEGTYDGFKVEIFDHFAGIMIKFSKKK